MSSSVSSYLSATKYQKVTPIPKGVTIPIIPSYENIEVEEATSGELNAASLTELDVEEWVCEYQRKQETQAELERKLQDHYEGKEAVNSW